MPRLRYYISGHGLGHASRSCQVLAALHTLDPGIALEVVSDAPRWFLNDQLPPGTPISARRLDVGVCQADSLAMDLPETLRRARALQQRSPELTAAEAASLRQGKVDLVVTDVAAIPCAAAAAAGCPAVILSNFTWDWIYRGFLDELPAFAGIAAWQRKLYAQASSVLRLPFHGPMDMTAQPIDLPLVTRLASLDRATARQRLGLTGGQRLGLISFGGFGLKEATLQPLETLRDWVFLAEPPLAGQASNLRAIPTDLGYPDLVQAADAVITKPGYGIVAECIAQRTAVLFTPRGNFREQALLVDGLKRYSRALEIDNQALRRGDWGPRLDALLSRPEPASRLATDGARVAAGHLAELLRRTARS